MRIVQQSSLVPFSKSGCVSWQPPHALVAIRVCTQVMKGICREAIDGFSALRKRGAEVGGILLGTRAGDEVIIEDFEPVMSEHRFGPSWLLSENDTQSLQETIDSFRSGAHKNRSVVGFYRSHTRSGFSSVEEDEKLFAQHFPAAAGIFLLLKPIPPQSSIANLFFWENGQLREASNPIPFPFESGAQVSFETSEPARPERKGVDVESASLGMPEQPSSLESDAASEQADEITTSRSEQTLQRPETLATLEPSELAPTGSLSEWEGQKALASEQASAARPLPPPPDDGETLGSEETPVRPRWFCYEGEVIGDSYRLGKWLGGTDNGSIYLSESGEDTRRVVIKLNQIDVPERELQLSRWTAISQLSHAHLIRLFAAGRCEIDGIPLLYVVMERAEENLSSVLAERCLSEIETREMLNQVLKALTHIHETGYVHGAIKPSNIMATGDTIKLSSDSLMRVGELHAYRSSGMYDPPEWAQGVVSPAGDVWSLGITLVQAVTQRLPDLDESSRPAIPENVLESFGDIIQHCLERDPHARWTVAQIVSRLRDPLPRVPDTPSEPPSELPPKRQGVRKWLSVAALAVIAVLLPLALKPSHSRIAAPMSAPGPASASRPVPQSPAATGPQAPRQEEHRSDGRTEAQQASRLPSAAAQASRVRESESWFVVVATYARRKDAEKRAHEIARRWPQFKTDIYAPPVENPHYLVIIGANLSEQSALALENQAKAAGLPHDTYVKRFPKQNSTS